MKIIVTGALGHIGSKIIRDFSIYYPNLKIILIDNMMTQRFCSVFNLPKNTNYELIEDDINKLNLEKIISKNDIVIHLAAITDAAGTFNKAKELEENNFNTTKKISHTCLKNKAYLISFSSTSVYGTQKNIIDENCSRNELLPQSPYAKTKLKEEDLVQTLVKQGLRAVTFRFGTIYGISEGMRFHTAVNKFCWQASIGKPITVWTTAYDQKRPYLNLNDASRSIRHVIDKKLFNGEIYNVLTENLTVRNIVDKIKSFIPSLKIQFVESEIMNQLSYEVSSEKFKNTGFKFKGNFHDGIEKTISLINLNRLTND